MYCDKLQQTATYFTAVRHVGAFHLWAHIAFSILCIHLSCLLSIPSLHSATHYDALQHTTTHCTHRNTLHHTQTFASTLGTHRSQKPLAPRSHDVCFLCAGMPTRVAWRYVLERERENEGERERERTRERERKRERERVRK